MTHGSMRTSHRISVERYQVQTKPGWAPTTNLTAVRHLMVSILPIKETPTGDPRQFDFLSQEYVTRLELEQDLAIQLSVPQEARLVSRASTRIHSHCWMNKNTVRMSCEKDQAGLFSRKRQLIDHESK